MRPEIIPAERHQRSGDRQFRGFPCTTSLLDFVLMRHLALLPFGLALCAGIPATASAAELWNGRDFSGWEFVATPATDITSVCHARAGVLAADGQPIGYIATTIAYASYRLHVEWRWTGKPGNGGVLVHISSGPKDRQWPVCFQVQWKNAAVGDLLPMVGASFAEPQSTPPGAKTPQLNHSAPDSERQVGEWNACDVVCRGSTIEVTVNGIRQNRVSGLSVTEGKVGIQLEGTPFELRNLRLTLLE